MSNAQLDELAGTLAEGTSEGSYTFEGESKDGKYLSDRIKHTEFYPDEDSIRETLTEILGLTPAV